MSGSPAEPLPQPSNGALPLNRGERFLPVPLPGKGGPVGDPAASGGGIGAATLVSALRRRWVLGVSMGIVITAVLLVGLWFLIPVRQTVETRLYMKQDRQYLIYPDAERFSPVSGIFQRTQMAMAKSRLVLNAALRNPTVTQLRTIHEQRDPIQWLEANVKTDFNLSPELLRISIQGDATQDLLIIINAIREAYLSEVVEKENSDRRARLETLKSAYQVLEETLHDKRTNFHALAEIAGSRDSTVNAQIQSALVEQLMNQRKELMALKNQLRRVKVDVDLATARERTGAVDQADIPEGLIEEQFKSEPFILKIKADLGFWEGRMAEAAANLTNPESDPALIPYKNRIEKLRESEAAYKRGPQRAKIKERMREKMRSDAQQAGSGLQQQAESLRKQVAILEEEVARLTKEANNHNKNDLDLEEKRQELAHTELIANNALEQIEKSKIEAQAPGRILGEEPAMASSVEGEKKKLIVTIALAGLGFIATFCGIIFWEAQHRRISTPDEVRQGLGLPLMGTLPVMRPTRSPDGGGVVIENPVQEMMNNAVDAARTVLLRAAAADQIRMVMITSAGSGEGKTSLSCHLAASLARSGRKVLLIDSDLRNPSLHALFGVPAGPGLCEVLRGEAQVQDVLRQTPLPNLTVLPAGSADEMALQVLSREPAREVFNAVKGNYEFVIVDSAPVLAIADSLMVGQYVDAVLFSILRDVSRAPAVIAAYERLSMLGIRILGAIVNGVRGEHASGYGYSYESRRPPQGGPSRN
jgi:capsular exopolysaccharide synthesis family protein